jgi:hypothetical protein
MNQFYMIIAYMSIRVHNFKYLLKIGKLGNETYETYET